MIAHSNDPFDRQQNDPVDNPYGLSFDPTYIRLIGAKNFCRLANGPSVGDPFLVLSEVVLPIDFQTFVIPIKILEAMRIRSDSEF